MLVCTTQKDKVRSTECQKRDLTSKFYVLSCKGAEVAQSVESSIIICQGIDPSSSRRARD